MSSFDSLQSVEQRVIRVVNIAATVMEEMSSTSGPRQDRVTSLCSEFMSEIKEIQSRLREEIKNMTEYKPFENCDYVSQAKSTISAEKVSNLQRQLEELQKDVGRREPDANLPLEVVPLRTEISNGNHSLPMEPGGRESR
ncbi:Med11 super family protein [Klebsormidium nitens]|uniref:Mediator of RNA polymerase II transcription subunit 11 n=1 Tax=Klebsormidium nitens TaxID=105231 RepID=A0A1Y1HXZ1_KLENI|nr:Med11 super family protein [Klebsormidium nitens]|eukprot:GAQ83515.1 Med11 super family protein [Klebsormidium nitens]